MITHDLKIKYEFAKLHFEGKKDWGLRKNDRYFIVRAAHATKL